MVQVVKKLSLIIIASLFFWGATTKSLLAKTWTFVQHSRATNLLTNPGFETGSLSGWEITGTAEHGVASDGSAIPGAYFQPVRIIAHSGSYAVFNLTARFRGINSVLSQTIAVIPDTCYEVGFWMLHGNDSQIEFKPDILVDGSSIGPLEQGGSLGYGTGRENYRLYHARFVSVKNQTSVKISFVLSASGLVKAGLSYDDFFLRPYSPILQITPTSGVTSTIINLRGYNYQPAEPVQIDFGQIATVITNSNGAFVATFTPSSSIIGSLTITATGVNSGKQARTFFEVFSRGDFGDAPDSSLYPMNTGYFCAPDDFSSPLFLTYQAHFPTLGEDGVCHRIVGQEYLGYMVTQELNAYDLLYDEDSQSNLQPFNSQNNQDKGDDGLIKPVNLMPCTLSSLRFRVSVAATAPNLTRYVNILIDWNQDGRWEGAQETAAGVAYEWAVQNQELNVSSGSSQVIDSTKFFTGTTTGACWLRISMTRKPISAGIAGWDGKGQFEYGETEDYLVNLNAICNTEIIKVAPVKVRIGEVITYSLVYANRSSMIAQGVKVTDTIPFGLTLLNWAGGTPTTFGSHSLSWEIGDLFPNQTGDITLTFRIEPWAGEDAWLTNTAKINCQIPEIDYSNNTATWTTYLEPIFGQNSILGRVTSQEDGVGLCGVLIKAIPLNSHFSRGAVLSDGQGHYTISNLPAGTYTVVFEKDGFTTKCSLIEVKGSAANLDISLKQAWHTKIAFCAFENNNYDLFVIDEAGGLPTRLTNTPGIWEMNPKFFRDGQEIVFVAGHNWNIGEIWRMRADGTRLQQLTQSGNNSSPVPSPDGSKIAYVHSGDIYLMNSDGSGQQRLTHTGQASDPAFSSEGSRIAFSCNGELYLMLTDATGIHQITHSLVVESNPTFSPDGSRIAFTAQDDNGRLGVCWMYSDSSDQARLTEIGSDSFMPCFSPDGQKICFVRAIGQKHQIYTMNVDKTGLTQVTEISGIAAHPSWAVGRVRTQINIWPGDTNNDGVVNAQDIFPIAIYWHTSGPVREPASIQWQAQLATLWQPEEATYADANGDGVVDGRDVLALGMNWASSHPSSIRIPAPAKSTVPSEEHLEVYRAMYSCLQDAPITEGVIQLKQALTQAIESCNQHQQAPKEPVLMQNYPNPFNPETWIPFVLSQECQVIIRIYNLSGQLIRVLDLGIKNPGRYVARDRAAYWDGRNSEGDEVASGVYFYQLQSGSKVMTKRMVVLK